MNKALNRFSRDKIVRSAIVEIGRILTSWSEGELLRLRKAKANS